MNDEETSTPADLRWKINDDMDLVDEQGLYKVTNPVGWLWVAYCMGTDMLDAYHEKS